MPPISPRRYDIVRHRVLGMRAPYLIVLQHQDVPSITRIIARLRCRNAETMMTWPRWWRSMEPTTGFGCLIWRRFHVR
jgi:hypothetical protein